MAVIKIDIPYVIEENDDVKMVSTITVGGGGRKELYYEVKKEYGQYFAPERGDAFLIALLPYAMVNGFDIECAVPVSEKLLYQLTSYYIPTLSTYAPDTYKSVKISAITSNEPIYSENAVGAAVSGGVDSFYTIVKHLKPDVEKYKLTHLLIVNSYNIYYLDKDTRNRFKDTVMIAKNISEQLGLPLIAMYSNIHEFWFPHYVDIYCLRYCSFPYALQKLFSTYFYSGAFRFCDMTFVPNDKDDAFFDIFTTPMLCSENFTVYSSGGECDRNRKVECIASNDVVQNNLQVCNDFSDHNCSVCSKCLRTEMNLYAAGKLQFYDTVFDLDKFRTIKNHEIFRILKERNLWDREILAAFKRNNISLPLHIKIVGHIGRIWYCFKQIIKRIPGVYVIWKMIKSKKLSSYGEKSSAYNTDKEFAKKCNPNII